MYNKSNNQYYNKRLKQLARNLRNNSTKAEIKMWVELLSKRQMRGYQFLRQRSIGNFIADFFCKELKLVIEVDGITHHWEETIDKDIQKENFLQRTGCHILRFDDKEVMNRLGVVYDVISDWIKEEEQKGSSPQPPSKGENSPV
jgi:very-short-patch-repair endonuclease